MKDNVAESGVLMDPEVRGIVEGILERMNISSADQVSIRIIEIDKRRTSNLIIRSTTDDDVKSDNVILSPTLEENIALQNFDWVDPRITNARYARQMRRLPNRKSLHFGEEVSSDEAFKSIIRDGCRPANVHEFVEMLKDWDGKYPVVCLGSPIRAGLLRRRQVLVANNYTFQRILTLAPWGGFMKWNKDCRFAAVY